MHATKINFALPITATGVIGQDKYNTMCEQKVRVVIENVGLAHVIEVRGKINLEGSFELIKTFTGAGSFTADVSTFDYIQVACTTYDPSGDPLIILSSFC